MNPGFLDPNNHVPDVSADDGWDNAEGHGPEIRPVAIVLPPRRKAADRAPENSAPVETGLRIGSGLPRSEPSEATARLEVQEINGGVIRLEQEVPPPPKVARQVTFHERPTREKSGGKQHGEGGDWGVARFQAHHWVIGGGVAVVAIVIVSLLLLPSINAPNKPREEIAALPIPIEEKDENQEAINRLVERQPEAIQLFRAYSQAAHVDEVIPMIKDGAAIKQALQSRWKPLDFSRQWVPTLASKWSVMDGEGLPYGVLEDNLPDGEAFTAYVVPSGNRLLLDWKATTAYGSATFAELAKGTGDPAEVRGFLFPTEYYSPSLPEQDYQSYRLTSGDQLDLIWCYVRRGSPQDAQIGKFFQSGSIINDTPAPRKITLRLEPAPEGAMPNQWLVAEMLHIDWVTP